MSSENNTKITIAIIGLIGILGTAFIANWDKVFSPQPQPDKPMPYNNGINHEPPRKPPPEPSPKRSHEGVSQRLDELQRDFENNGREIMKLNQEIEHISPMLETDSDLPPIMEQHEMHLRELEIDRELLHREIEQLQEQLNEQR